MLGMIAVCVLYSPDLSLPTPPADSRLPALLRRRRTLYCLFRGWASDRALEARAALLKARVNGARYHSPEESL